MHNLLVLTIDPDQPAHDPSIVLTSSDGKTTRYLHVETFDGLHQYRNEALSEEDARRLIA